MQPQWRADGRELFYLASDGALMSVRVVPGMSLTVSSPTILFSSRFTRDPEMPTYAVTADGQRFLGLEQKTGGFGFTFLINWLNGTRSSIRSSVR
jgi:hypothetical protein